jgi:hypothetical protein
MNHRPFVIAVLALSLVAVGCSGSDTDSNGSSTSTAAPNITDGSAGGDLVPVVFNGQGNNLVAYDSEPPFEAQTVITNIGDEPDTGLDINAQICFWTSDGDQLFIAGEDTGQPDPPAGWGIFRLDGRQVGDLAATQIGKLTPTYQEGAEPENYGCGLLEDGRLLTTDIGNQALGPGTGQLIIWFPPFDSEEVAYCKIDIGLATAQSIRVDPDDNVFVASARPGGEGAEPGVWRYQPPFPTGPGPDDGCETTDPTGAPLTTTVDRQLWIPTSAENALVAPAGLAPAPDGGLYVSSVITGVINEYDAEGEFARTILAPDPDDELNETPYRTGTPLGIGIGPDGTLYYADIGVTWVGDNIGPGDRTGSVRRISFDDSGEPLPPETMADDLPFPDGIGVFVP